MKRFLLMILILATCGGCQDVDKEIDKQPDNDVEITPGVDTELEVDKREIMLDYKAQSVEIVVTANVEFEVDVCADWITYTIAESGDRVVLSVAENTTVEPRTAEVVIIASDLMCTVAIEQSVKPEMISLILEHSSVHLSSPAWSGSDIKGMVDWGDGMTEEYYEGISHDYSDTQKRNAQFTMEGATSFRIERVGEIESVILAL